MDVVSSSDVLYLFFDVLSLLFHTFQRNSVHDSYHPDHTGEAAVCDLGREEWELYPGQFEAGVRYIRGKEEQGVDLVGVHVIPVSFHDGAFSFCRVFLSQWTDLLLILRLSDPVPMLLSGTDGEAVKVAYTDHNVEVP